MGRLHRTHVSTIPHLALMGAVLVASKSVNGLRGDSKVKSSMRVEQKEPIRRARLSVQHNIP